jgi:hypothetical protein
LTNSDRLKNLASLIRQLFKTSRIVRFATELARKARGEKPLESQYSGSDDPILVRQFDSENQKPVHDQIPKDAIVDAFDTDRNIFDPMPDPEIDFSKENDLEAYTKRIKVPREVIERWVAAGILRPDEIKVAEKMLKIMRENDSGWKKRDSKSRT